MTRTHKEHEHIAGLMMRAVRAEQRADLAEGHIAQVSAAIEKIRRLNVDPAGETIEAAVGRAAEKHQAVQNLLDFNFMKEMQPVTTAARALLAGPVESTATTVTFPVSLVAALKVAVDG